VWPFGCPFEIRPLEGLGAPVPSTDRSLGDVKAGTFHGEAFQYLFPNVTVPEEIGVSCCAQFAVTAAQVRQRSKRDYERNRRWLLETPLHVSISGRVMEYSWHSELDGCIRIARAMADHITVIFGKEAVHCPNASGCYCELYGLCNLICEDEGVCRSQYTLAKSSVSPEGWPDFDWKDYWCDVHSLRAEHDEDYTVQTT